MSDALPRLTSVPWQARVLGRQGVVCGAGLLVDRLHVLTCAHVVAAAVSVNPPPSTAPGGKVPLDFPARPELGVLTGRVVTETWAPESPTGRGDVAVLRLDEPLAAEVPIAPLRRAGAVADREVTVFGFPRGLDDGVWARGRIVGTGGPGQEWLQVDPADMVSARVEPGFSGAGAVDSETGSVVGMVLAVRRGSGTAWMLPVDVLIDYWPSLVDQLPRRLGHDPAHEDHWGPRGRGAEPYLRTGWYFTGRVAVLREINQWLAHPKPPARGLVVTGDPGAGKSAVLARLVTLAEPGSRREVPDHVLRRAGPGTVPEIGSIDVAVNAAGRTLEQVARQIADTLGVLAVEVGELVQALIDRGQPTVLVIDGLDEAVNSPRLLHGLINPLLTSPLPASTRLLIGMRRELLTSVRTGIRMLDLDDPTYLDPQDIVEYTAAYLLGTDEADQVGPYRGEPALAYEIAGAVARRAGGNFLVAQLSALELLSRTAPVDVNDRGWQERFPTTVADAMDSYLLRMGEALFQQGVPENIASPSAAVRWVRDLLTPLALAEGEGLVDDALWAELAGELGTRPWSAHDVRLLRTSPALSLCRSHRLEARGEVGWRLFHQSLAEHLVADYHARHGIDQPGMHDVVVRVLRSRLPGGPDAEWRRASSYTRLHLADHAAKAGRLQELVVDAGYLLAADPQRLIPHLSTLEDTRARQAAQAYLMAAPQLRADLPHIDRVNALRLTTRLAGVDWLASDLTQRCPQGWDAAWSYWRRPHPHQRVAMHGASAEEIAFGEVDGEPVLIGGGAMFRRSRHYDAAIRVWNLTTGSLWGPPLVGDLHELSGVAFGLTEGTPIAVGWGPGGSRDAILVESWDLRSRTRWRNPFVIGEQRPWTTLGRHGDRPVMLTGHVSGELRAWDLVDGSCIRTIAAHTGPVRRACFVPLDGVSVVVSTGADAVCRSWDLITGRLLVESRVPCEGEVTALSAGTVADRPCLLLGGGDGGVWSIDLGANPRPQAELLLHVNGSASDVCLGEIDGRPVALACDVHGFITVADLTTRPVRIRTLAGHDGPVLEVALGRQSGNRPVAITTGADGSVRIWDLSAWDDLGPAHDPLGKVESVSELTLPSGPAVIGVGQDARVRCWDLSSGRTLVHAARAHNDVRVVRAGELFARPIALTMSRDSAVEVWELSEAGPKGRVLLGSNLESARQSAGLLGGPGPNLACGMLFDRLVALVADHHGDVQVLDVLSGRRWALFRTGRDGGHPEPPSIAATVLQGRSVVAVGSADGTVNVLDLATGAPIGGPIRPGGRVYNVAIARVADRVLLACVSDYPSVVTVWDLTTRAQLGAPLAGHTAIATTVAIGDIESQLLIASGGEDRTVRIWDVASRRCTVLEVGCTIFSLAMGPGPTVVAGASFGVACFTMLQPDRTNSPPA